MPHPHHAEIENQDPSLFPLPHDKPLDPPASQVDLHIEHKDDDQYPDIDAAAANDAEQGFGVEVIEWQAQVLAWQSVGTAINKIDEEIRNQCKLLQERVVEASDMDLLSYNLYIDGISIDDLVNSDVNLDQLTSAGLSLVHLAVLVGNGEWIAKLANAGVDLDVEGGDGLGNWAPLHLAAALASIDNIGISAVRKLIENGANPDISTYDLQTPLSIAAKHDHINVLGALIESGSTVTNKIYTDYIQNYGNNPNDSMLYALWLSKHYQQKGLQGSGCFARVDKALALSSSYEADNTEGWTELHKAAKYNDANKIKFLHHLYPPLVEGLTLLEGFAPVHIAAMCNSSAAIEALASRGANLYQVVKGGARTSIHLAVLNDSFDALKSLVKLGVSVDLEMNIMPHKPVPSGISPMFCAVSEDRLDMVDALIALGAKPHPRIMSIASEFPEIEARLASYFASAKKSGAEPSGIGYPIEHKQIFQLPPPPNGDLIKSSKPAMVCLIDEVDSDRLASVQTLLIRLTRDESFESKVCYEVDAVDNMGAATVTQDSLF